MNACSACASSSRIAASKLHLCTHNAACWLIVKSLLLVLSGAGFCAARRRRSLCQHLEGVKRWAKSVGYRRLRGSSSTHISGECKTHINFSPQIERYTRRAKSRFNELNYPQTCSNVILCRTPPGHKRERESARLRV